MPQRHPGALVFASFVFGAAFVTLLLVLGVDYAARQRHIYIASSFFVTDLPDNRTLIRTLAVAEKSFLSPQLSCLIDGHRRVPATVLRLELFIGCKWGTYFIECPAAREPHSVQLIGANGPKSAVALPLTRTDPTPRKFVVCFSRMFFFERWQAALTALHMYRRHGTDLMVIPVMSVIRGMYEILREYEAEGWVRLKRAAVIPNIDELNYNPNAEVDWFNQVLNFDECLYEYREGAEFIAFADMDDIMIPRNYPDLYSEFAALATANPQLASFEFNWGWATAISPPDSAQFSIQGILNSLNVMFFAPKCGKPVVRPKRVREGFIHHPEWQTMRGELLAGFGHRWFRENTTVVAHLRHIFGTPHDDHPNATNLFASPLDGRYSDLDAELEDFLDRHPLARAAMSTLPTQLHYYEAMHRCIERRQFHRCHSALICAPAPSDDLPECVVLSSQPERTVVSPNWILWTSGNHRFEARQSCGIY